MLSPLPPAPTRLRPSFQSPVPISGRPWLPTAKALVKGPRAVFEQSGVLLGNRGLKVRLQLIGVQDRPFEKGDHFVQNPNVAADLDVVGGGVRQPDPVVGDARADSLARRRMPPMLNVALDKLPRGRAQ